jgi:hypothetical protein
VAEEIGDHGHGARIPQHSDVDGFDGKIGGEFGKSIGNYGRIYGLDPANSLRGLDGQGCNAGNTIAIVGGNGLDVG